MAPQQFQQRSHQQKSANRKLKKLASQSIYSDYSYKYQAGLPIKKYFGAESVARLKDKKRVGL